MVKRYLRIYISDLKAGGPDYWKMLMDEMKSQHRGIKDAQPTVQYVPNDVTMPGLEKLGRVTDPYLLVEWEISDGN